MASKFDKRSPTLPPEAIDRERELAERYTRISSVVVPDLPDATRAHLVVGGRSFCMLVTCENRKEGSFHCWMLARALAEVIEQETTP